MKFVKQYIKNPIKTGAITPSSKGLAKLITKTADLPRKETIVEFGSGDGVITEQIIEKIDSRATFFSIEINQEFVRQTKKKCPKATVYHDSAKNVDKYLAKQDVEKCSCIISALPWAVFDNNLQKELLSAAYKSLEEGGEFLTVAYFTGVFFPKGIRFKKLLDSKFRIVKKTRIVWWNILPAFVYHCKK
ncbi:MAG: Ribosomal RNA small subunit methyltransferase A [Candidatus Woesearchaeota archaeon]|nr:Ribosomal RNA small subunit methyltransferase A [Candidatus Woesearchaeota archaeon]